MKRLMPQQNIESSRQVTRFQRNILRNTDACSTVLSLVMVLNCKQEYTENYRTEGKTEHEHMEKEDIICPYSLI